MTVRRFTTHRLHPIISPLQSKDGHGRNGSGHAEASTDALASSDEDGSSGGREEGTGARGRAGRNAEGSSSSGLRDDRSIAGDRNKVDVTSRGGGEVDLRDSERGRNSNGS